MFDCPDLAVPQEVMQHVVRVESSRNPFAIGVVGGYLERQPRTLEEALAAVQMLKAEGYNFSVGIAQVNRYNLAKYGIRTYAEAFEACPNLRAGSRILRECYDRAQDWGKAFSCYYSGNFVTGYEHGYVQKIFASMRQGLPAQTVAAAPGLKVIPYDKSKEATRTRAKEDALPLGGATNSAQGPSQAAASSAPVRMAAPSFSAVFGGAGSAPLPATATKATTAMPLPGARSTSSTYPEPAAVRQQQAAPRVQSAQRYETTEDRPAIPVPGPGAVMPAGPAQAAPVVATPASAAKRDPLAGIPVEMVGVNGNPYQTKVITPPPAPAAGSMAAGTTQGLPASQLPLPDPNQMSLPPGMARFASGVDTASAAAVRDVGKLSSTRGASSRKGGSLLHANESSGSPETAAARREEGGSAPRRVEDEAKGDASDRSFVF